MYKCEAVSSKENTIKYYTHIECTPTYKSMGVVLSTWSENTIDNVFFFFILVYMSGCFFSRRILSTSSVMYQFLCVLLSVWSEFLSWHRHVYLWGSLFSRQVECTRTVTYKFICVVSSVWHFFSRQVECTHTVHTYVQVCVMLSVWSKNTRKHYWGSPYSGIHTSVCATVQTNSYVQVL